MVWRRATRFGQIKDDRAVLKAPVRWPGPRASAGAKVVIPWRGVIGWAGCDG